MVARLGGRPLFNPAKTALVVAACVLGLLAALVSNTQHADIVAVLCVIALLGLAPAEVGVTVARSLAADQSTPSSELLALGDSCMSSEIDKELGV